MTIPEPWFRAQSHSTTMGFITGTRHSGRLEKSLGPGERLLGWMVLPPFQRPPVWTEAQRIRFIESAWAGLPLGSYVLNMVQVGNGATDCWLLDGQQRVGAVLAYEADEFPVHGLLFSQLEARHRRKWEMGISFPYLETQLTDEAELREVYDRLAYGGTPHEPKALIAEGQDGTA